MPLHLLSRLRVYGTNWKSPTRILFTSGVTLYLYVEDIVMGMDLDLVVAINLLYIVKSKYTAINSNMKG